MNHKLTFFPHLDEHRCNECGATIAVRETSRFGCSYDMVPGCPGPRPYSELETLRSRTEAELGGRVRRVSFEVKTESGQLVARSFHVMSKALPLPPDHPPVALRPVPFFDPGDEDDHDVEDERHDEEISEEGPTCGNEDCPCVLPKRLDVEPKCRHGVHEALRCFECKSADTIEGEMSRLRAALRDEEYQQAKARIKAAMGMISCPKILPFPPPPKSSIADAAKYIADEMFEKFASPAWQREFLASFVNEPPLHKCYASPIFPLMSAYSDWKLLPERHLAQEDR